MCSLPPLRIFYLEDNPLIVFHVEAMIEDLGCIFGLCWELRRVEGGVR